MKAELEPCTGLSPSVALYSKRLMSKPAFRSHFQRLQFGQPCGYQILSLGFSHFIRHYCGNPSLFLFLPLLRCFNSGGLLTSSENLCWKQINLSLPEFQSTSVSPFSNLLWRFNRNPEVSYPRRNKAEVSKTSCLCEFQVTAKERWIPCHWHSVSKPTQELEWSSSVTQRSMPASGNR
jgi:hypothetical protein